MIIRDKNGILLIINRYDFTNDKLYYQRIKELVTKHYIPSK